MKRAINSLSGLCAPVEIRSPSAHRYSKIRITVSFFTKYENCKYKKGPNLFCKNCELWLAWCFYYKTRPYRPAVFNLYFHCTTR